MKYINNFISEKLIINKNTKFKKNYIEPEDIEGPETPGKDSNGEDITIIGKPFKSIKDKSYTENIWIIQDKGDIIEKDLYEFDEDELGDFKWFAYIKYKTSGHTVFCCGYGLNGVYAIDK